LSVLPKINEKNVDGNPTNRQLEKYSKEVDGNKVKLVIKGKKDSQHKKHDLYK
jgi:hypothetical protein